jgi:cell division protein FtsI (penicillin-binding protein 3)
MSAAGQDALALRLPPWRSRFVLALVLAGFAALAGRAFYLQGLHNDFLRAKGEARFTRVLELPATRGPILDRNGEPLAISTPVESVAASPADVAAAPEQLERLARLLALERAELEKRLADKRREFVYLKRQLPPQEAADVVALGLPGVFLQREYRRYYPAGEVTSHLIGFTDIDERGQEAIELAFERALAGRPGSRRVIRDRLGRVVEDVEVVRAPQDGRTLRLAVDTRIQYLAFRELKRTVEAHRARAGSVVVLDVATGEVLAMANVPSYNPNNRARLDPARVRNRAVTDLFEPGSTLKPFTVAAALETGRLGPKTAVDTNGGALTIGDRTIHDVAPLGTLTVAQVIQKSSNIGAAKIALGLEAETLWGLLRRAGFGTPPGSGLPGEAAGKLRPPASWRPIEQATISYGHGISVSLLQLARAYTIFATDGELRPVTVVKGEAEAGSVRAISAATAAAVRAMLEAVTAPGGTGTRARIPGYRVAGKTGTSRKVEGDGYASDRFVASFVGFAPASSPRLVVAVMVDEPSAGEHYGGTVAAPLFARVTAGALRLLGVPYDAPLEEGAPASGDAAAARERA